MGQPADDRWNAIADAWEARVEDGYYAFNDAHAMMAFVGADRPAAANALLRRMTKATGGASTNAMMTRDIGLPVARALQAFGNGDYGAATDLLLPVRGYANRFGGSHAQRDVLTRTLIEAALRAKQYGVARAVCNERTTAKPAQPLPVEANGPCHPGAGRQRGNRKCGGATGPPQPDRPCADQV